MNRTHKVIITKNFKKIFDKFPQATNPLNKSDFSSIILKYFVQRRQITKHCV
jgi:hypothetical protein